jgi:hypothetical protein
MPPDKRDEHSPARSRIYAPAQTQKSFCFFFFRKRRLLFFSEEKKRIDGAARIN